MYKFCIVTKLGGIYEFDFNTHNDVISAYNYFHQQIRSESFAQIRAQPLADSDTPLLFCVAVSEVVAFYFRKFVNKNME
jgi:hypothetical protein